MSSCCMMTYRFGAFKEVEGVHSGDAVKLSFIGLMLSVSRVFCIQFI